jgi:hypothetical protein
MKFSFAFHARLPANFSCGCRQRMIAHASFSTAFSKVVLTRFWAKWAPVHDNFNRNIE